MGRERRRFKRVHFEVTAEIVGESFKVSGVKTRDLSVKGAFIESDKRPSLGSTCLIKLLLTQGGNVVDEVSVKAEVVRKDEGGFAVEFKEIPLGDYIKLKRIVELNLQES